MGYFNVIQFRKETKNARVGCAKFAYYSANTRFQMAHKDLLEEFDGSEITKEINAGAGADNISDTLNGVPGNLYGFIGFVAGSRPMVVLRQLLDKGIYLSEDPIIQDLKTVMNYIFAVEGPSIEELKEDTPYEEESSLPGSFLEGIEEGIPGLTRYIYARLDGISRSKAGIQVKTNLKRSQEFQPKPYVLSMVRNFYNNFSRKNI